jgi:membrane protease subunit HflK
MKDVMRGMDKVLIDNSMGGTGVVPYLPLSELTRPPAAGARPGGRGQ